MDSFCRIFHQFPVQTNSALRLLNNAGYIEYHEEQEFKSALHFILKKEELYRIYETDADTDLVIQTILRTYPGVFANFVYIEETNLAHLTGLAAERIYHILKDLHHHRIIDFIPHKKTPVVCYTMARVETDSVNLPPSVYEERKIDFQKRIDEISEYVTSVEKCRSRMLLSYFGEEDAADCGQCDVCLARKKAHVNKCNDVKQAVQMVTEFLQDGKEHRLTELKSLPIQTPLLEEAVRCMAADELLVVDGMKIKFNK
jgi:ATP-dependent DNA helicase RecQ